MRLPVLLNNGDRKSNRDTIIFTGIDRRALIKDNSLSACKNISLSRHSPLISRRPSRETLSTLVTPKCLFSVGTNIVTVDNTDFKYNGVVKGTVTASAKSMVDFNGKIIIMPDKKYYDYTLDVFDTIVDIGPDATVPNMDYICIHMNRLFGVKGNSIYASALGQYNNWSTFAGESTDSWAKDVASDGGNFTGTIGYQNHPIVFKSELMYELYNNKPDYVTQPVNKVGCLSNRAIVEVSSVLYFAGSEGIYAYTGGTPRLISESLNEKYSDAVMGSDGSLLYVSLYNGTTWNLYVYDTLKGSWIQEDNLQVVQFTKIGKNLYVLAIGGALYKFNSGAEVISWEIETKDFTEEIFNKKGNGALHIRANLSIGTTFNLYTSIDGGAYTLDKTVTATASGITKLYKSLKIKMSDRFKVKMTGTGDFDLYAFGREVYVGEGF